MRCGLILIIALITHLPAIGTEGGDRTFYQDPRAAVGLEGEEYPGNVYYRGALELDGETGEFRLMVVAPAFMYLYYEIGGKTGGVLTNAGAAYRQEIGAGTTPNPATYWRRPSIAAMLNLSSR